MKNRFARREIENLISLGISCQAADVLFESIRMGLFDAFEGGAASAGSLSRKLDLSAAALSRLLEALLCMGLLEKKGNFYVNTAISKKYLCKTGTSYAGDYFIHLQSIKDYWAGLYGSLRTNKMARPGKRAESDYAKQLKKFLYAMDAIGRIKFGYIKKIFPIGRYRNMLDLGGGMGTYAVNFARENRSLNVIVYDLKNVAVHAKKYIKEEGMQGRIKVFAGQCIDDPLPEGPFDIVFISNLLHIYDKQDCKKIIRKSAEVLEQNGALLIHDYIFGSGRTLAIPLFDLTMLVGTPQGRCYSKKDLTEWMKSAGISQIKTSEVIAGSSIVWGKKR